jgi:hypothetical protein
MNDLRNVYILADGGKSWKAYLVDGKQAAFTTREKAVTFRKKHRLKGYWLYKVTLCQADICIPATVDPVSK